MMSSRSACEKTDGFKSKREVVLEECVERAQLCDRARDYLESTVKELRIPLAGGSLPLCLNYTNSISKLQTYINEVVNTPLVAVFRELDSKKSMWKQQMQANYLAYRDGHDNDVLGAHHALLNSAVPSLSRIEQALRACAQHDDPTADLVTMEQLVGGRAVQTAWAERLATVRTAGYPVPRLHLPTKLSTGLELIREGLNEMELTFEAISASEPFEAKETDWFSYSCLEPLVHQVLSGSLASGVGSDGEVTIQLCEFDSDSSLSRAEVLDLIAARLKFRILLADPSLRLLALNLDLVPDLRFDTHVAVCRWTEAGPEIHRGRVEAVDAKARQCAVLLIDLGHTASFAFDEVYIDECCPKDLRSIPPLAITCRLHPASQQLLNPAEVEAALRAVEADNKGRFTFRIAAEYFYEGRLVWEIFVSDAVSRELQFPPPSKTPTPPPKAPSPPPPPPKPMTALKVEAPVLRGPPQSKLFRRRNSSPKTPPNRRGQPSPRTPPVPKTGPVDKQKPEPKTPPAPKAGPVDKAKPEPKPGSSQKTSQFPAPKTPPVPKIIPDKSKPESKTPPVPNAGPYERNQLSPKTPPFPKAASAQKSQISPKTVSVLRTPPGPRIPPVPKKVYQGSRRNTNLSWQKELMTSIVQNNSKRKNRLGKPAGRPERVQESKATIQRNEWLSEQWGDSQ